MKRVFAASTVDVSRQFVEIGNYSTTPNWWEDPPTPPPKESMSSAALRHFHKLRVKMKRSMSFGKSKDFDAEKKEEDDDLFYKPPKGDPYYEDMENYEVRDLSDEGVMRMKKRMEERTRTISRPMKLRKRPSKEVQALREKKSREQFRKAHPLSQRPSRPALRAMSTTPNLRDRNKRDSGYINDLLPEFPAPPVPTQKSQAELLLQELQEKRARLGSASMADLSLSRARCFAAGASGRPSKVELVRREVTGPYGVPPIPPLPRGAVRPRFPSQPSMSFRGRSSHDLQATRT